MDFFKTISKNETLPKGIFPADISAEELLIQLQKTGLVLVWGSGFAMNRFYQQRFLQLEESENFLLKKFILLQGDILDIRTALSVDSRKAAVAAFRALSLTRYDSWKMRLFLFFLVRLNNFLFPFYRFIFSRQFCFIFDRRRENFLDFLHQKIGIVPENLSFSIFRSSKKFICPISNIETGNNFGYAKIYKEGEGEYYGRAEADALHFLEKIKFESAEPARLLANGYFENCLINIISSKGGLENFRGVSQDHLSWIEELARKTGAIKKFDDSEFARILGEEMDFLKKRLNGAEFDSVFKIYEEMIQVVAGKSLLLSFVNREFDYYELLHHNSINLVIDWEHAQEGFPPIFDVFSLLLSDGQLISSKNDYVDMHVINLKRVFFLERPRDREIIRRFSQSWKMSRDDVVAMFVFFLIDRLCLFLRLDSGRDSDSIMRFFVDFKNDHRFK